MLCTLIFLRSINFLIQVNNYWLWSAKQNSRTRVFLKKIFFFAKRNAWFFVLKFLYVDCVNLISTVIRKYFVFLFIFSFLFYMLQYAFIVFICLSLSNTKRHQVRNESKPSIEVHTQESQRVSQRDSQRDSQRVVSSHSARNCQMETRAPLRS